MIIFRQVTGLTIDHLSYRVQLVEAMNMLLTGVGMVAVHQITHCQGWGKGISLEKSLQKLLNLIHKENALYVLNAEKINCLYIAAKNVMWDCCIEECFESYHTKLNCWNIYCCSLRPSYGELQSADSGKLCLLSHFRDPCVSS